MTKGVATLALDLDELKALYAGVHAGLMSRDISDSDFYRIEPQIVEAIRSIDPEWEP